MECYKRGLDNFSEEMEDFTLKNLFYVVTCFAGVFQIANVT